MDIWPYWVDLWHRSCTCSCILQYHGIILATNRIFLLLHMYELCLDAILGHDIHVVLLVLQNMVLCFSPCIHCFCRRPPGEIMTGLKIFLFFL